MIGGDGGGFGQGGHAGQGCGLGHCVTGVAADGFKKYHNKHPPIHNNTNTNNMMDTVSILLADLMVLLFLFMMAMFN